MALNSEAETIAEFCSQPDRAAQHEWLLANRLRIKGTPFLRLLLRKAVEHDKLIQEIRKE